MGEAVRAQAGLAALTSLLLLAACGESTDPPETAVTYELIPTGRFGWNELADSTRPLTDHERLYGGAVLGNPTAVAEGPGGEVYVLDGAFKKIVVFSPDGEFLRLFTGGAGEGPGEFGLPVSLSWGPGGDLWIHDLHLQRITRFSPDGRVVATLPVPPGHRITKMKATGSHLYGTRFTRDSIPLIVVLDSSGKVVGGVAPPNGEDIRLAGRRSLATAVGPGPAGTLVVAHPDVGTWSRVDGLTQSDRRGQSLFPEAVPVERVDSIYGIRIMDVAAQPSHAGAFEDGLVYVRYRDRWAPEGPIFKLALYDSTGALLSIIDSMGVGGTFAHSARGRTIYIAESEPFPRISRFLISAEEGVAER